LPSAFASSFSWNYDLLALFGELGAVVVQCPKAAGTYPPSCGLFFGGPELKKAGSSALKQIFAWQTLDRCARDGRFAFKVDVRAPR
jgi:hypothetical protein